jgi:hypothetical protein
MPVFLLPLPVKVWVVVHFGGACVGMGVAVAAGVSVATGVLTLGVFWAGALVGVGCVVTDVVLVGECDIAFPMAARTTRTIMPMTIQKSGPRFFFFGGGAPGGGGYIGCCCC